MDGGSDAADHSVPVNYMVQGTAADQLTSCLHRMTHSAHGDRMISCIRATIHDALLIEVPDTDLGAKMAQWFSGVMSMPYEGIHMPTTISGPAATWRKAMDFVEPPS